MMAPRLLHNMSVRPRPRVFHPEEPVTRSHGVGLVFRFSVDDWGEDPRRVAGLLGSGVPGRLTPSRRCASVSTSTCDRCRCPMRAW